MQQTEVNIIACDTLCDVIGCYGYDVFSAAAAAQRAKDKDRSSAVGASINNAPILGAAVK